MASTRWRQAVQLAACPAFQLMPGTPAGSRLERRLLQQWLYCTASLSGPIVRIGSSSHGLCYAGAEQEEIAVTQGAQYGLIQEYGLNYLGIHSMI